MLAAYISYKYKDHWTCHQSRMVSQTYEQKKTFCIFSIALFMPILKMTLTQFLGGFFFTNTVFKYSCGGQRRLHENVTSIFPPPGGLLDILSLK